MALTTKPISTISYNSPEFLRDRLDSLFKAKRIADYRYILHFGEEGDKDHFHVWLMPGRRLDTAELVDFFSEPDPLKPDKPLGVQPFRKSDEDNWLMYSIHDPEYLETHNTDESHEKIPYTLDDVQTPFPDALRRTFRRAVRLRRNDTQRIIDSLMEGNSPMEVAYSLGNVFAVNALSRMMLDQDARRWKRPDIRRVAGTDITLREELPEHDPESVEVLEQLGWWDERNQPVNQEGWIDMDVANLVPQVQAMAPEGLRLMKVYKAFEGDFRAVFVDNARIEHRYFLTLSADTGALESMEERV